MKFSKPLFGASCAILAALSAPVTAQAGDVNWSLSADLVSDYVFRGVSLADTAAQTGVEVGAGNFYAGAWFSTGVGDTSILAGDEVDLYMGYGLDLSEVISADVGVTYYHYPQGGSLFSENGGAAGTYEVYGGLAFDYSLSPSLYAFYDFTLENFTVEGSVGHSVAASDSVSLDLGLSAGLVDGNGFSYEYGTASAAVSKAITDTASVYVGANYTLNSEDALNYSDILAGTPQGDLLWFGTGISTSF
ncbi:MAG: TorF family putative porin [Litorimonas sp.]